jgi:hypothetical protein
MVLIQYSLFRDCAFGPMIGELDTAALPSLLEQSCFVSHLRGIVFILK